MKKQKKLTQREREEVLAILTLGCSRAAAARSVMRSPHFLRFMIASDPEFAEQVAKAESGMEIFCLSHIRQAIAKNQNCRTALWLLERRLPNQYAAKKPETLTPEHIQKFIEACMKVIIECVPNKKLQTTIINRLTEELTTL